MERQAVQSSNVASVGYDAESKVLEVEFKGGGVYRYQGVPAETWVGLVGAPSVGKYLGAHIKGVFLFERG